MACDELCCEADEMRKLQWLVAAVIWHPHTERVLLTAHIAAAAHSSASQLSAVHTQDTYTHGHTLLHYSYSRSTAANDIHRWLQQPPYLLHMSTSFTTSLFPGICMAYMWGPLKLTESDIAILTISIWYSHWGRRGYHQILIISNDINSELRQDERFFILRLNISMCNFSKFRSFFRNNDCHLIQTLNA